MLISLLLAAASLVAAAPSPLFSRADQANTADLSKCPGYAASNVVITDSGLTADLKLNGQKCNTYGLDLEELKLVVEHQSGE
jgi:alpha-glucosidase